MSQWSALYGRRGWTALVILVVSSALLPKRASSQISGFLPLPNGGYVTAVVPLKQKPDNADTTSGFLAATLHLLVKGNNNGTNVRIGPVMPEDLVTLSGQRVKALDTTGGLFELFAATKSNVSKVDLSNDVIVPLGDLTANGSIVSIAGDNLYVVTSSGEVYVTSDHKTWQEDTAGLGGPVAMEITMDTAQTAYLATYSGVFKQGLGSRTWQRLTNGPMSMKSIFAAIDGTVYAGTYNGLVRSTDGGATWSSDSAGMGYQTVSSMADDWDGTVYAITTSFSSSDHLWSKPSGGTWRTMDAGLVGLCPDRLVHYLRSVAASKNLEVATSFGLFESSDNGASWHGRNEAMPAEDVYQVYEFKSGTRLVSTALGVFTKGSGDDTWRKRFPSTQYLPGVKFFVDNSGMVFALGASTSQYGNTPKEIWTSMDEGVTWSPDTVGLSALQNGIQFVDELGTEHLATYASGHPALYAKAKGGSWAADSAGYVPVNGDGPNVFASDHHGWIYLALTNPTAAHLLKRPISGGAWSEVALDPSIKVPYQFTSTKDGKLVGGNSNTAMGYYDGSTWTVIPNPPGLSNPSGYPVSVDSSNRLWAIVGTVDGNSYYSPYGVFWTSDLGQHWTQAADGSNNFTTLESIGDTTYGLNFGNGLAVFVPGSAFVEAPLAPSYEVMVYPNPSTGEINMVARGSSLTKCEVIDANGNLLLTRTNLTHALWDARDAAGMPVENGTYLLRITGTNAHGGSFTELHKVAIRR